MNDDLRQKLAHDLKHSGFYSEMLAIRTCIARRWECHGSFTYFDKDEQTSRECDFEAVRRVTLAGAEGAVEVVARLLGQVKKSERPWIVFKDEHPRGDEDAEGLNDILHSTTVPIAPRILAELREGSLLAQNGWRASGIHEGFKKPGDNSAWYGAFVTACKAAESVHERARNALKPDTGIHLHFIKPVVVVDALVVTAELDGNEELLLTEIDKAAFTFEYQSHAYARSWYQLDVVTLAGLPEYLDVRARQLKRMAAVLEK
ncbi:MAG TPA: hypothetical protein VF883_05180 [Thermoanaerobaculia bacterium]|jgi:hypothetical protein